jgi:hypothetical protein
MSRNEDIISQDYPYAWREGSDVSIQDFLIKARRPSRSFQNLFVCAKDIYQCRYLLQYKPSMVQDDGTKPVSQNLCSLGQEVA